MWSTPIDNESLIELLFFYPPEYEMPDFSNASVYLYDLTEDKIIEAVMTNDLVKEFSQSTGFSNSARLLINGSDMKEYNSYYVKIDGAKKDGNIIDNINFVFMYVTGEICMKTGDTQPGTIYFPRVGGSDVTITKTEIHSGESTIVMPAFEKIIHWQDPAVEAIVRQALKKETGDITISEATRYVGSLFLYRDDIKTIADLKWFPNVRTYSIRADLLQDASLLHKGAYIELFFDGLTSLSDIDKLCNIEEINKLDSYTLIIRPNGDSNKTYEIGNSTVSLQYANNLKDFSGAEVLLKFEKLISLDLSGNGINDISELACLSGMNTLFALNLSGNNLSDISLIKDLKNIDCLLLNDNQIKDISCLSSLTNLRWIMLNNNRLEDISALNGLKQLDYIFLSNNQIKDISPLQGLNPSTLDLSWNQITDISCLDNMKGLSKLFLANNAIGDISSLKNLDSTVNLSLYNNPIGDWSYEDHIESVTGRPN
jgi:internalin A